MGLFDTSDVGIDLGTSSILVYVRGRGIVLREPSIAVVERRTGRLAAIGEQARAMVGRTPPELAADVAVSGILLTGGGSLLRGMDTLLAQETGMATHLAEDPIRAVALGLEATLPHLAKRQEGVLNLARRRQVAV